MTDDELVKTVKPILLVLSVSLLILASLLLQWWGEKDNDVRELSFTWFGMMSFCGIVLVPAKEFARRFEVLIKNSISTTKWFSYLFAALFVLVIFIATSLGQAVSEQEIKEVLKLYTSILIGVLLIFAGVAFILSIGLPFVLKKAFTTLVRWLAHITLKKDRKNPLNILLLFISGVFIVLNLVVLICEKVG